MRNQEWDSALAQLDTFDLSQLVFRLFCCNTVHCKSAFGIIHKAEILAGFFNRDDVLKPGGVGGISADFPINLDQPLHQDCFGFTAIQSILESRNQ